MKLNSHFFSLVPRYENFAVIFLLLATQVCVNIFTLARNSMCVCASAKIMEP